MEQLPGHRWTGCSAGVSSTDWILAQFGKKRAQAQKQYREFVGEGMASRPWEELKGQIYLGSEGFIEKHAAPEKGIRKSRGHNSELPSRRWSGYLQKVARKRIAEAYGQGYRLNEIAAHLGVHYATVSRRLKQIEQTD